VRVAPPKSPAPRKSSGRRFPGPRVTTIAFLLLLTGGLVIGATLYHSRRSRTAAPAWGRTPSPEELARPRAVAQRPGDAAARRRLGEYYLRRVLPFEAAWEFSETLALRPTDGEARAGLASALDAVYLPELSQELLRQPVDSPADDLARRLARAGPQLRYGEGQGAGGALHGAGEQLEQAPEALLVQGRVLQANGNRTGAEAGYRRSVKLAPGQPGGYYWLGRLLLEASRPAEARTVLTQARRVAPADARFPFYLGLTYMPPAGSPGLAAMTAASAQRARTLLH